MALESNREAAAQCIAAANEALSSGDVEKAQRLLERSKRMYPLEKPQTVLQQRIQKQKAPNGTHSYSAEASTGAANNSRSRKTKQKDEDNQKSEEPSYTKEQLQLVRKINRYSCYYEVLGLRKGTTDGDVSSAARRGYKRLALKLHPDKNQAPGADEAFKKVARAFQVLSDERSRKRYDMFGAEGVEGMEGRGSRSSGSGLRRRHPYGGMSGMPNGMHSFSFNMDSSFGNDGFYMNADDLFDFLFSQGGGLSGATSFSTDRESPFQSSARYRREQQRRRRERAEEEDVGWCGPRGYLFFFFFLAYSLLFLGSNDPDYSMQRSSYYKYKRTTDAGVQYYTTVPSGTYYTQRQWLKLDKGANSDVLQLFMRRCSNEQEHKRYLGRKASSIFTINRDRYRELYDQAETPSCTDYMDLKERMLRSYY